MRLHPSCFIALCGWLLATTAAASPTQGPSSDLEGRPGLAAALEDALREEGHDLVRQVGTPFAEEDSAWVAPNRGRGLRSYFLDDRVRVLPFDPAQADTFQLDLALEAVGRGALLAPAGTARLAVDGARAEYQRDGIVEWYVNAPSGLEQGFDLASRPLSAQPGPLELHLAPLETLRATLESPTRVVLHDPAGQQRLEFAGLFAYDAEGAALPARFVSNADHLSIEVDDSGARYPIVVDPTLAGEEAQLVPSLPVSGAEFGLSIDVFGGSALVGAPRSGYGAAYLFGLFQGEWRLAQKFVPSDEQALEFGWDVCRFDDFLAIGAPQDGVFPAQDGAVYVFRRDPQSGEWFQSQKLGAPMGESGRRFGDAVDLSDEYLMVGAPFQDGPSSNVGAVYVFAQNGNSFQLETTLLPGSGVAHENFGTALEVQGARLAVGGPGRAVSGGGVYLYTLGGMPEEWTYATHLSSAGLEGFGASVALASPFVLGGAPDTANDRGSAALFEGSGSTYTLRASLAGATAGESFGRAVDLQGLAAGRVRALVGAPDRDGGSADSGVVYLYEGDSGGLTAGPVLSSASMSEPRL